MATEAENGFVIRTTGYEPAYRDFGRVRSGRMVIYLVAFTLAALLTWAQFASLDVVSTGEGQIVPAARAQIVQHMEGGVLKEMKVRVGQYVSKGDVVARIDETAFASQLGEISARAQGLDVARRRLMAELEAANRIGDPDYRRITPVDLPMRERALFEARLSDLENQFQTEALRLRQSEQAVEELEVRRRNAARMTRLIDERVAMVEPAVEAGYVARSRLIDLRLERQRAVDALETARTALPKAESMVREARSRLNGVISTFQATVTEEIRAIDRDLDVAQETIRNANDRVSRTVLLAPVDGIVNKVEVNTIGGTIRPGQNIVEITPVTDDVLLEVLVQPKDIGFIQPNQRAIVKFTSYDFSIYGSYEGKVQVVGADSIKDEKGNKNFQLIIEVLKAENPTLEQLTLQPGMTASVDVVTDERTVMQYILGPIYRGAQQAMRER